ncbi:MAG: ISKra4 family transposase [Actinobacteria bacterium]|nr:ISKra4 family transposase [Actinomycetota bacterium]
MTHEELEIRLDADGRALTRQLLQDHLDLRAEREQRQQGVVDAQGCPHNAVEADHRRRVETIFGEVTVTRLAYRAKRAGNLHVADAALNLPAERHSHGLRRLAAVEASRGSYQDAAAAITRQTGVQVGKRQVEALAASATADFESFYQTRERMPADTGDVVVISADGKGIVMRPEALRAHTARAAARSANKLKGRLSRGEKANRKRMAEVGAVYTVTPEPRTPDDVMARSSDTTTPKQAPKATGKWVTASVVDDAANVIAAVFEEAQRRDPEHSHDWVALVDGNRHQIIRIRAEAKARGVTVTVIVDWVHVLEYLWSAAWSFYAEGDPAAENWVHDKALDVLRGKASTVAAAIRRKATMLGLAPATRRNADTCANYLLAKAPYLNYPSALANGWPIATGVIEGACRHIVKDRMDITGARWGLDGAEAVLKLRALRANGDWDAYWHYHLTKQHDRVHAARYLNSQIPTAA